MDHLISGRATSTKTVAYTFGVTKVQIRFALESQLDEAALERIADANSIYGVEWIKFDSVSSSLLVEYDATRLRPPELESALRKRGLSITALARQTS